MSRNISMAMKLKIAGKQNFKCANKPDSNLKRLENYSCPLWNRDDIIKGSFDESGFDIDHIIEYSLTQNNNESNLQALCNNCHAIKTKRFMMDKNNNCFDNDTDSEYDNNDKDSDIDEYSDMDDIINNKNMTYIDKILIKKQLELKILKEKNKQLMLKLGVTINNKKDKYSNECSANDDIYVQYIEERTEPSDKHIHTSTLYSDFKQWFIENNPKVKIPSNRVFVASLRNHLILEQVRVNNKSTLGIKYIRLINPNNDI
jgi:hypothetical protein